MKIIRGIKNIRGGRLSAVAIGVFDGLHIGHRHLLSKLKSTCESSGLNSCVVTFWPHPQREGNLYSLEHRLSQFSEFGINSCVLIKFTPAFSRILARDFVRDVIHKKLRAKYVFVGENFRFGSRMLGDIKLLKKLSAIYGFELKVCKSIKHSGRPVSSTGIRKLIKKGDLLLAGKLLTLPVSVWGRVERGDSLANSLGFPTANIVPSHEIIPPHGVYAVKIALRNSSGLNGRVRPGKGYYYGVCYIGQRPTIKKVFSLPKNAAGPRIEVHIFNFNKNIYGEDLEIYFIGKIRSERRFSGLAQLSRQIRIDKNKARKLLKQS